MNFACKVTQRAPDIRQKDRLDEAIGCRLRLQRLRDARAFYGWVVDVDKRWIRIRPNDEAEHSPGDPYRIHITTDGQQLELEGKLIQVRGEGDLYLVISGAIQWTHSTEIVRYSQSDLPLAGTCYAGAFMADIVDASEAGIGIVTGQHMRRGDVIDVEICGAWGKVTCEGRVKYCRKLRGQELLFRIGVRFEPLGRVALATWKRGIKASQAARSAT